MNRLKADICGVKGRGRVKGNRVGLRLTTQESWVTILSMAEVKKAKKKIGLDGRTWTRYSISVWSLVRSLNERKYKHPAAFPEELPKRLIEIYTHKGDIVLDPFLGVGTTCLAARGLERKSIGFEISEDFIKKTRERLAQQEIFGDVEEPIIYKQDARNISEYIEPNTIDFVVTSPPYWDIHRRARTADRKKARPYSEDKTDLGNITSYQDFIESLKEVFEEAYKVLKLNKYCAINVMDIRRKSKFYPFHMDVTKLMQDIGFELKDIIVWDRQKDYNNLRPLGYPYVFIVNKVHEYILLFKKGEK
jgi:DNA modification methylase